MNDPRVASLAAGKTRGDVGKQFLSRSRRHQVGSGLTSGMERIAFAERNHLLDDRLRRLGARDRSGDALFFDHIRHQVTQCSAAMGGLTPEFRAIVAMSHRWVLRALRGPRFPPWWAAKSGLGAVAR